MPVVVLRAPLKDLADGNHEVEAGGASVADVLRAVEAAYPRLVGWILDEQGQVRRHVNVFLNGERVRQDTAVAPGDRLHVLPSITGGS